LALRVDDVDLVRDRALVERFQEGDSAAFDTLYVRYFPRLVRFCQKRVGDRHEAEEIAQEAFARALRALPAFQGERRFYPWLTVIAGRLCVDSHRRRGRSEPSASIELGVIEGGQEQIVDAVDVALLSSALGRLAPRHREVLDLREQQGWSYQQIADHYGVTLGTVEALLFRARKALRREFLAVVGDDGLWAGIPVLGIAVRALARWKARLGAWGASALPTASGGVMAAAVAVTAVTGAVGVGVGIGVLESRVVDRAPAVIRMSSVPASLSIPVPAGSAPETADGVATVAAPHGRSSTDADGPSAPAPLVEDHDAVGQVAGAATVERSDDGYRGNQDAPVVIDAAGQQAGVQVATIGADAATHVNDAKEMLP
jgi:RNA polymerase sigma-70 factor (ECF subfamily)